MIVIGGGGLLIVAAALHIAWIARMARERGRSILAWVLLALVVGGSGLAVGLRVVDRAASADGTFVTLLGALAPFPLLLVGMLIVAIVLHRMPPHVAVRREWKVSASKIGDGVLVLGPEIELRWEGRTDTIARADVRSAVADGECVRLTWAGGEALLMPMMAPQTRDGRIRQSRLLATLLAPR